MAAQTPGELLEWLADHQFLAQTQAAELRPQLANFADCRALVKELVHVGRRWLTPYQANQILTGAGAGLVFGPFRLLERIGEGAMGQVLKAWHVRLGKFVAVKMVHQTLLANAKTLDRFRQEMESAAHLVHPNIVLVLDADKIDERPYLAMEFCEGINLSQLVQKQGPLSIHLACDYIRQAALGLQHAAEHEVVHRDIKPSNLLLTNAGADQAAQVKILDFGLARVTTLAKPGRLTTVGNLLGTVDYVAPEQIENAQNADVRSDIYSLGCTLYFLLAGRPPFAGTSLMEKITGRIMGQVPQIQEARPDVPQSLDAVMRRILAPRPKDRYQTAAELADALAPFSRPSAVPALPTALTGTPIPQARLVTAAQISTVPVAVRPAPVETAAPQATEATALPPTLSNSALLMIVGGLIALMLLFALFAAISASWGNRDANRSAAVLPDNPAEVGHAPTKRPPK